MIGYRDKAISDNPHLSLDSYNDKFELLWIIVKRHKIENGITLCSACHKSLHAEKCGELLETPNVKDEDNQQASQSNVINIVDWKLQRLIGEDSQSNKPDTSAAHVTL